MTGQDVLTVLRSEAATRSTPVVVASADATAGQAMRLLEAGADRFLTKPLDVTRLLDVIDELLDDPTR
jgi:CheY-like chemotaxis protein